MRYSNFMILFLFCFVCFFIFGVIRVILSCAIWSYISGGGGGGGGCETNYNCNMASEMCIYANLLFGIDSLSLKNNYKPLCQLHRFCMSGKYCYSRQSKCFIKNISPALGDSNPCSSGIVRCATCKVWTWQSSGNIDFVNSSPLE